MSGNYDFTSSSFFLVLQKRKGNNKKTMQFKASKTEPPVGALITLEAVKKSVKDVSVKWDAKTAFDIGDNVTLTTNSSIARYLARSAPDMGLYGGDIQQKTEVPVRRLKQCQAFSWTYLVVSSHLLRHFENEFHFLTVVTF